MKQDRFAVHEPFEVELMRHGVPVGGRRYRGDGVDDPLSELGWRQMWAAVGEGPRWRGVVTSPLRQSREFAEAAAARFGLPCRVDPRLREIGMGAWEGLTPEAVQATDPARYEAYYLHPVAGRPPGGESLASLRRRVSAALNALAAPGPWLVVAHAVVIRAAIAHALAGSSTAMMRIPVAYAGITRLRRDRRGWTLLSHQAQPPAVSKGDA